MPVRCGMAKKFLFKMVFDMVEISVFYAVVVGVCSLDESGKKRVAKKATMLAVSMNDGDVRVWPNSTIT